MGDGDIQRDQNARRQRAKNRRIPIIRLAYEYSSPRSVWERAVRDALRRLD